MEKIKLKVERCFALLFNHWGRLISLLQGAAFYIEQALAIVHQRNDHSDKSSIKRSHC